MLKKVRGRLLASVQRWFRRRNFITLRKARVKGLEESVLFFSPEAKQMRERWVTERFMAFIRPETEGREIECVDAEPWDTLCLGAKFQIKEIQEPGRRRHAEYKEALQSARKASSTSDFFEADVPTTITADDAARQALTYLDSLKGKYAPAVAKDLDLLFYLNIDSHVSTDDVHDLNRDVLSEWRSVAIVCNDCAVVLAATQRAPEFIRRFVGVVRRQST